MITKTSIQGEIPDFYECKKGDAIKIHTFNFVNAEYNRQFSKYGVDAEYTVVYADSNNFTLGYKNEDLVHTRFSQRNNSDIPGYKFSTSFSLVNYTLKNLKDFK